uniref:Uncharacterized protein n=1 Tax=Arundo donax TaxID=35708 RepID=A0A0A9HB87_ARUDO
MILCCTKIVAQSGTRRSRNLYRRQYFEQGFCS